jgi:Calcineurin-like phosphoesterase
MPHNSDYDIIGDIHGHADALERLLRKLGYTRRFGVYSHPGKRKVVFVGDFIDRGPKIRETLHLVKDMVESGNALSVMGNHEFNAISFHTPHTEKGGFFRDHSIKEIKQHIETLDQFKNYDSEWADFLEWFKTLPLYLDLDHFRVVHACWNDRHIEFFQVNDMGITADVLSRGNNKSDKDGYYIAINDTLKGTESKLPKGYFFTDKDGTERHECRVKWWSNSATRKTLGDVLIDCPAELALIEINGDDYLSYADTKPVFFGHYWLRGKPRIENPSAICLDFSVAKGGVLAACRLGDDNGELQKSLVF